MKVYPKNDAIRKILKHPSGGAFRAEGPAEWPDDSYTARRIADGDVTTDAPASEQPAQSEQGQSAGQSEHPQQHQSERLSPRSRPTKHDTE